MKGSEFCTAINRFFTKTEELNAAFSNRVINHQTIAIEDNKAFEQMVKATLSTSSYPWVRKEVMAYLMVASAVYGCLAYHAYTPTADTIRRCANKVCDAEKKRDENRWE